MLDSLRIVCGLHKRDMFVILFVFYFYTSHVYRSLTQLTIAVHALRLMII